MSRVLRYSAYFLGALAVVILSVEICALFASEPSDMVRESYFIAADSNLGWVNRPNTDGNFVSRRYGYHGHVSFDADGIRRNGNSARLPIEKTLLVIGDSTTLGMEVDNEKAYPSQLERLFWKNGRGIRVINAAGRGYGIDQSYLKLKPLLTKYHPDLVLFMAGPYGMKQLTTLKNWYRIHGKPAFAVKNDRLELVNHPVVPMEEEELAYIHYRPEGFEIVRKKVKPSGISRWLRNHSFLYSWLDRRYYESYGLAGLKQPRIGSGGSRRLQCCSRKYMRSVRIW